MNSPDDDLDDAPSPTGGLTSLKYSVGNLWDDFGSTSSPVFGLVINGGLAAIGVLVYLETTGVLAAIGLVWAILNALGVIQWVFAL